MEEAEILLSSVYILLNPQKVKHIYVHPHILFVDWQFSFTLNFLVSDSIYIFLFIKNPPSFFPREITLIYLVQLFFLSDFNIESNLTIDNISINNF